MERQQEWQSARARKKEEVKERSGSLTGINLLFGDSNKNDMVRIWKGGPWLFEGQLMRLTKWSPDPNNQRMNGSDSSIRGYNRFLG